MVIVRPNYRCMQVFGDMIIFSHTLIVFTIWMHFVKPFIIIIECQCHVTFLPIFQQLTLQRFIASENVVCSLFTYVATTQLNCVRYFLLAVVLYGTDCNLTNSIYKLHCQLSVTDTTVAILLCFFLYSLLFAVIWRNKDEYINHTMRLISKWSWR